MSLTKILVERDLSGSWRIRRNRLDGSNGAHNLKVMLQCFRLPEIDFGGTLPTEANDPVIANAELVEW